MKIFQCEFQVRGYELDGYGHVNNAVYLNYAEFARWRMIEDSGSGGQDYFKRHNLAPVVVRVEVDYREPCFLAEWLKVETELLDLRTRSGVFHQKVMKKDGKMAAELKVTFVLVSKETGKAVVIPEDFQTYFGTG